MKSRERYREIIKEIQGDVSRGPTVFVIESNKKVSGKLLLPGANNFLSFVHSIINTYYVPCTVLLVNSTEINSSPSLSPSSLKRYQVNTRQVVGKLAWEERWAKKGVLSDY